MKVFETWYYFTKHLTIDLCYMIHSYYKFWIQKLHFLYISFVLKFKMHRLTQNSNCYNVYTNWILSYLLFICCIVFFDGIDSLNSCSFLECAFFPKTLLHISWCVVCSIKSNNKQHYYYSFKEKKCNFYGEGERRPLSYQLNFGCTNSFAWFKLN